VATLATPDRRRNRMYGNSMPHPRKGADKRFKELWRRQLDLLAVHCAEWVKPLIGKATGVVFERGCVEGFSAQPRTFVKHAAAWYQSMPIRQLCIAGSSWSQAAIADKDLLPLLKSPVLLNLRTLDLGHIRLQPSQVAALADSPYVTNLRELFLGYPFNDQGLLKRLRESPGLKNARIQGGQYH
jgi:hypothetical protein